MEWREATLRDVEPVVDMVLAMLQEMAAHGGHALNQEEQVRSTLRHRFVHSLQVEDHVYLLAVPGGEEGTPAGVMEASVVGLYEVFRPRSVLHIHSLYVQPGHRGQGLGRRLVEAGLEWGRRRGCVEAELNVLVGNPARRLYEKLGFQTFELELRRGL
jgi:GNAT superfamily N-acetyltransferase